MSYITYTVIIQAHIYGRRERERERVTIVVQKLLNKINMSHEHSSTTVTDQPQCIKRISAYHIIKGYDWSLTSPLDTYKVLLVPTSRLLTISQKLCRNTLAQFYLHDTLKITHIEKLTGNSKIILLTHKCS